MPLVVTVEPSLMQGGHFYSIVLTGLEPGKGMQLEDKEGQDPHINAQLVDEELSHRGRSLRGWHNSQRSGKSASRTMHGRMSDSGMYFVDSFNMGKVLLSFFSNDSLYLSTAMSNLMGHVEESMSLTGVFSPYCTENKSIQSGIKLYTGGPTSCQLRASSQTLGSEILKQISVHKVHPFTHTVSFWHWNRIANLKTIQLFGAWVVIKNDITRSNENLGPQRLLYAEIIRPAAHTTALPLTIMPGNRCFISPTVQQLILTSL
jgi:hypothetical protein